MGHFIKSHEESWLEKFEQSKSFFELNNKRPSSHGENKNEKILASWISRQLQNRVKNKYSMENIEIRDIWDKFRNHYIEHFKSNEEIWYEKFEEVKSFIEINEKRPSDKGSDKYEKSLGKWLSYQIQKRAKNQQIMTNTDICNNWDIFIVHYAKYFKTNKDTWYDNLEKSSLFIATNKKRPSGASNIEDEKKLGKWISHQLHTRGKTQQIMMEIEIRDIWDNFIRNHAEYFKSNEEKWYEKLNETKNYITINKKRPSGASKNKDEQILGRWVSQQIQNRVKMQQIMTIDDIRSDWDAFVRG